MDRRSFLHLAAGVGFACGLPRPNWIDAPELEVNTAWRRLCMDPLVFHVSPYGTLELPGVGAPRNRADCLDIQLPVPMTYQELWRLSNRWRTRAVLATAWLDFTGSSESPEQVEDGVLRAWLRADPANLEHAHSMVTDWLQGDDLDEWDLEDAERNGRTPQGAAVAFWRGPLAGLEPFEVGLVEGEHPGSSYVGAELHMPVEDANRLAARLGAPVRFVQG